MKSERICLSSFVPFSFHHFSGIFLFSSNAVAQEKYPTKPIQLLIHAQPGGSLDLAARIMTEKFKEYLDQPMVVINKTPSALCWSTVATAKPDGYTLLFNSAGALTYIGMVVPSFKYGLDNFSPIAAIAEYPHVLVVGKEVPASNMKEFVAYAKKNSNLSYGTTGNTANNHLAMEAIKSATGIPNENLQAIHYEGIAPSMTALMGNQIQAAIYPYSAVIGKQIQARTIKALGIYNKKRSSLIPGVPTLIEQGLAGLYTETYQGFLAPAKTPDRILKQLEDVIRKACSDKEVQNKFEQIDQEMSLLGPKEYLKYMEEERERFGGIIKKLGLQKSM